MSWDYRMLRAYHKMGKERYHYVEMVSVYYDNDGTPRNYAAVSNMAADSVADLQERLELMRAATEKPLLKVQGNQLIETTEEEL